MDLPITQWKIHLNLPLNYKKHFASQKAFNGQSNLRAVSTAATQGLKA